MNGVPYAEPMPAAEPSGPTTRRTGRGSFRRRLVRTLAALAAVLLLWLVACYVVVVRPRVDAPQAADAIVVLGPPEANGRYERGLELLRDGYAHTLVLSGVNRYHHDMQATCRNGVPGDTVLCFYPDPKTTQGEAEEIRTLAASLHWRSIIVVTSRYHLTRARMIVQRCFSGTVSMVDTGRPISLSKWGYEFLYQTGAFAKALVKRSC